MASTPKPGHAIFYDRCTPPLSAGKYKLKVEHDLTAGGNEVDSEKKLEPKNLSFDVAGPRFRLQADEIHSAYPPANSQGPFESRLPCVVMRRRTLPWERTSEPGQDAGEDKTWLALMLFEEDEVKLLEPHATTVGDILSDKPAGFEGAWAPNAVFAGLSQAERSQACLGIEVNKFLFDQVAPAKEELELLSHVRQVNTEDKELLGQDKDGWFSVVVANRLPVAGKKYVACLVSLEGQLDILPNANDVETLKEPRNAQPQYVLSPEYMAMAELNWRRQGNQQVESMYVSNQFSTLASATPSFNIADDVVDRPFSLVEGLSVTASSGLNANALEALLNYDIPKVKLVCLAHWKFECKGKGDFGGTMAALPEAGGVGMLGMSQREAVRDPNLVRSHYAMSMDSGHTPLKHLTRRGELKNSLYRSPFIPVGVTRNMSQGPYHHADQARLLDIDTGLENISYAAAFEIGRLLGLNDPHFALMLMKWRRGDYRKQGKKFELEMIGPRLPERIRPDLELEFREEYLDFDRFMREGLFDFDEEIRKGGKLGQLTDPSGLAELQDVLPGLNPAEFSSAFGLPREEAAQLLGRDPGNLGGGLIDNSPWFDSPQLDFNVTDFDDLVVQPADNFVDVNDLFDDSVRNNFDLPEGD